MNFEEDPFNIHDCIRNDYSDYGHHSIPVCTYDLNNISQEINSDSEGKGQIRSEEEEMAEEKEEVKKEEKNRKYEYHNFQKHLVTILRNNINISEFQQGFTLEKQLWRKFLSSKSKTKSLISVVFGIAQQESKENIQKNGFKLIYQNFSLQEIRKAQQNLKSIVLHQMKGLSIEDMTNRTRISAKQNFQQYLKLFIKGLENGNFLERFASIRRKKKANLFI